MCDRRKWRRLCLTRLAESSGEFIPWTRCSIPKGAIGDFLRGAGRWASKSDHRWRTCVVTRLNRNRVVEILRLVGCENLKSEKGVYIWCVRLFSASVEISEQEWYEKILAFWWQAVGLISVCATSFCLLFNERIWWWWCWSHRPI